MSLTLALLGFLVQAPDTARILDEFEGNSRWAALPSEGVALAVRPDSGIVVRSPRARPVRRALLNRQAARVVGGREVVIRRLPAELTLWY